MNNAITNKLSNMHLAGIIPVSGSELNQENCGILFHPCLTRVGESLLAIERSILECNFAGCETIWIICNEDIQPVIKSRVGDSVSSIESIRASKFSKFKNAKIKQIPIFYVPIPLSLRGKRDSLGWSILHGANEAFMICAKISKWVTPNKYYVSFPYSVYDPTLPLKYKSNLTSTHNLAFEFGDQTISDGLLAGFTFRPKDFKKIRKAVKEECTGSVRKPYWSSRFFNVDKFFKYDNIDNVRKVELTHFYPYILWSDQINFLSSKDCSTYDKFNLQNLNSIINERIS